MDKRINADFRKGLEKKRIDPFKEGKESVSLEIQAAEDDLSEAIDRFEKEKC